MITPEQIRDAADPIDDFALIYYLDAYEDVKRQLDEIATAVTATLLASAADVADHPDYANYGVKPALTGEKLRHEIKRILQLL